MNKKKGSVHVLKFLRHKRTGFLQYTSLRCAIFLLESVEINFGTTTFFRRKGLFTKIDFQLINPKK